MGTQAGTKGGDIKSEVIEASGRQREQSHVASGSLAGGALWVTCSCV